MHAAGLGPEINAGYIDGFVQAASRRELKPVVELLGGILPTPSAPLLIGRGHDALHALEEVRALCSRATVRATRFQPMSENSYQNTA